MKKLFIRASILAIVLFHTSCESCVKNTSKKITELGISAIEGVSEAVSERGDMAAEKAADALGSLAKGAGRSLEKQLDEHAEHVAKAVGRTFVQSIDGFEDGIYDEFYAPIPYKEDLASGVSINYFGKIKSRDVIDAYFLTANAGTYACSFSFLDANGKVMLKKEADFTPDLEKGKIAVVSFALNQTEKDAFSKSTLTQIEVKKK